MQLPLLSIIVREIVFLPDYSRPARIQFQEEQAYKADRSPIPRAGVPVYIRRTDEDKKGVTGPANFL
jgi:hypothetical protein